MGTILQDLKYGLRMLAKNPGFTAVAVMTLALGIGANTAIFSVVNAVLLRPLPYRDSDRLAMLWTEDLKHGVHDQVTSYPNFEDWKNQSQSFEDMAIAYWPGGLVLTGSDPEQMEMAWVSANFFPLLGMQPALGRTFSPEEEQQSERVVVLSHALWQRRFGSSPEIAGKTVELSWGGQAWRWRVIGVMSPQFQLPAKEAQLWAPATLWPAWSRNKAIRGAQRWHVLARLKRDITFAAAQSEMNTMAGRLARAYPQSNAGYDARVVPLHLQITGSVRLALSILYGAVVFVLLIACANVANLALARGAARQRELAVRAALGAGRARLIRQLLTESAALSCAAGIVGLLLAGAAIRALITFGPGNIPRLDEIRLDPVVLVFTAGASLLAGILAGLAPAWRVSQTEPNELLKAGGRGARPAPRGALVAAEFALAMVLLTGAGLLIRSSLLLRAVDPGFTANRILFAEIPYSWSRNAADKRVNFCRRIIERVESLPGVVAAGVIADFFIRPDPDGIHEYSVTVEGRPPEPFDQLSGNATSPAYFKAMGVPLLRGRLFSDQDGPDRPSVTIINEAMARRLWPGEDPIGKRFRVGSQPNEPWLTVVGVVGDMRRERIALPPTPQYFQPHTQRSIFQPYLAVRIAAGVQPSTLAPAIVSEVRSVDPTQPRFSTSTLADWFGEMESRRRFQTLLLGLFAAVALLLAAIGIYGLIHYSVAERTHEIGIRMALGARAGDVLAMVIRQGLRPVAAGAAAGLVGALWLTRVLASLLYGVTPTDPATFATVCCVLLAVALLACYIPARRATKVDPMVALRYE